MVMAASIGALGSIGAGVISGAMSSSSAKRSFEYSKLLAEHQAELNYKYGKKATLNQYKWQRKGLQSAGYNPLLALGGAEGVANTGWTSAQSGPNPEYENSVTSALQFAENYRQNKLADSQTKVNDSTIENTKTDTQIKENQRDITANDAFMSDLDTQNYQLYANLKRDNAIIENKLKNEQLTQAVIRSKFLPDKEKAEILQMLTASDSNSASAFFNRNRALGYSDSYSESDSHSEYGHGASFGLKHDRSKTKSYSHTR